MSIQAVNWAIETRVGDPVLKVLLMTLANYANTDDQTWHKQETIAHDTEISVRTLRRRLHELVDMGLIEIEERRRDDGTKSSSLITIVRGRPPANLADGATSGQKEGSPAATTVAGHRIVKNRNKDSCSVKKQDAPYSEEFEELWKQYPRTRNTSKKDAWNFYRMMTDEKREVAKRAVPVFAAAMRAEGRPEDKIMHMIRFLRGGVYETVSAPSTSANGAPANTVPFHKRATREQWAKVLEMWRERGHWSEAWGPDPDLSSCKVPADLLAAHNLKYRAHLFRQADLDRFEKLVGSRSP